MGVLLMKESLRPLEFICSWFTWSSNKLDWLSYFTEDQKQQIKKNLQQAYSEQQEATADSEGSHESIKTRQENF